MAGRLWTSILTLALLLTAPRVWAGPIYFDANADLRPSRNDLQGSLTLTLHSEQPIYNVYVYGRGQGQRQLLQRVEYWHGEGSAQIALAIPSPHLLPGIYHLLLELAFQDMAGSYLNAAIALDYQVTPSVPTTTATMARAPSVAFNDNQPRWQLDGVNADSIRVALTSEPSWLSPPPLTPRDPVLELIPNGVRVAERNWPYPQKARLDWIEDGAHYSRVIDVTITTDRDGNARLGATTTPSARWWRTPALLYALSGVLAVAALMWEYRRRRAAPTPRAVDEFGGVVILGLLTAWLISHAAPELWFTRTWSTGGDIASQVFYAKIFMEWVPTGKISGWIPESFAGFPAFTFYFPWPFTLAYLASLGFGPQVGFKLASMAPAFLLPTAAYVFGLCLRWPVTQRLLIAAASAAFITTEATSIWGGNVLAQLAGEFAYNWGMVFVLLFWGVVAVALRHGGRWWLFAALLEAVVAVSHGYALLIAGFGAFVFVLFAPGRVSALRVILQIHTVAFLLIGAWFMPLVENLPWTIPNDTGATLKQWQIAWPETLWPFAVGVIAWIAAARYARGAFVGLGFLAGIGILGAIGFFTGHNYGLAEARFFPYAQWGVAAACGSALGWWLHHLAPRAGVALAAATICGMCGWWEPHIANIEGWSRWNLDGYETKPMWPFFRQAAQVNAGPLTGPRVIFEHDPDNNDVGSTRAMEALPMFGSRPALEGLYMESAITSPFIYQLQEEVSKRPSAPLSRYPTTPQPIDRAVGHFNELYTNRLILRSEEMKQRYRDDPRFRLIDTAGPFQTFELTDFHTQLVDIVPEPLRFQTTKGWQPHAYRRFVLHHPYQERTVYTRDGAPIALPAATAPAAPSIRVLSMERERLVFETNAPGVPHLIRMTFHPRWRSVGGEPVYLTEPSFMLVVPQRNIVELEYGWSWGNYVGALFSTLGLLILAAGIVRRLPAWTAVVPTPPVIVTRLRDLLMFATLACGAIGVSWWTDPEHVYFRGHRQLSDNQFAAAAKSFDAAFAGRNVPASRAEALFWAARALDLADDKDAALTRYAQLQQEFPENFWYPESVFRQIEILHARGVADVPQQLLIELRSHAPASPWTQRASELLQPKAAP